jgi:branched-chain amino acid transport system permease protein
MSAKVETATVAAAVAMGHPRGGAWFVVGAGALLLCALPILSGGYFLTLMTEAIILSLLAMSVNLLLGHTGLISLGQAAYWGAGAYGFAVSVLLFGLPVWAAMGIALAGSLVLAFALSFFCLNATGVRFLLITLAFSQLLYATIARVPGAGGDDGLISLRRLDLSALGVNLTDPAQFHLFVFAVFSIIVLALWCFLNSPFGSVLAAIRENENRARAVGYDVRRYKRVAFVLAGLVAAVGGVLQAQNLSFVAPEYLSWKLSAEGILMVIIGGRRAFLGPVAGCFAFLFVREGLSFVTEDYLLVFGLFFMAVVALFRHGLAGLLPRAMRGESR